MLKSYGVGWWVAHVILVSAQGPNPSFFLFGGTFIRLGSLLGQGLGPGLDNSKKVIKVVFMVSNVLYNIQQHEIK